ncbi:MAG TPA: efflux transporter outer membrane subunit [Pararobbsia sp.]|nr:efflux transporter outer membrane subunit [Pararobbsia sp.]
MALKASSLAALALCAACTMIPHYERPDAPVAASYPTVGDAAKAVGNGPTAAADLGWRNFFTDPRLQKLVELSLKNNRDLRVAALQVDELRGEYQIQRAALMPEIDAQATGTRESVPPALSQTGTRYSGIYQVNLAESSWELDFWGRVRSLSQAALQTYFASAEARKATEILLVSQVADQYLTLLAFDDELKVTNDTLTTATESYRLAKLQFDVGTGSELDLRQAEGVVETARANYQTQLRLRGQALNNLVLLVGEPLPDDLPPATSLGDQNLMADIPAGLPSDMLTRRPDIMEAEAKLKSANANIGAARAAFFPKVTLTSNAGTISPTLGGLFKAGSGQWAFTPTISLPIFDGGANIAGLAVVNADKKIAVAQYEKAVQSAFTEVANGLAGRGTYDAQIEAQTRFTATTQRRLDLSNLRYKSGIDSYLNVLTAQNDLYSAQLSLIQAQLARQQNLVDLYEALGGGWIEHTGDTPRPSDVEYSIEPAAPVVGASSATAG